MKAMAGQKYCPVLFIIILFKIIITPYKPIGNNKVQQA